MRLWVTRTQPQADATARRLRDLGHEPIVQPVLVVRPLAGAKGDLAGAGAIAFTSQNGVEAFAALSPRRDLPVFTTGEATAQAARQAGFATVEAAGGGLEALAALIERRHPTGQIVWPGPVEPAGDLAALLAPAGIAVSLQPVYETAPVLDPAPQKIDGVIVHSPKAARAVAAVLETAAAPHLILFAISPASAAPLSALPFQRVSVAPRPDETALLSLLGA